MGTGMGQFHRDAYQNVGGYLGLSLHPRRCSYSGIRCNQATLFDWSITSRFNSYLHDIVKLIECHCK